MILVLIMIKIWSQTLEVVPKVMTKITQSMILLLIMIEIVIGMTIKITQFKISSRKVVTMTKIMIKIKQSMILVPISQNYTHTQKQKPVTTELLNNLSNVPEVCVIL